MFRFCVFVVIAVTLYGVIFVNGSYPERVLLTDIGVLTLHKDRMTNARRSNPVPQLKCVGGSAGCYSYVAKSVQCYNRGSDGHSIQWECKADMDQAYRFGELEVSCEGYDYPDDPYILKGSCGLEYTIDLTNGGHQKKHQRSQTDTGMSIGNLVVLGVILFILYKLWELAKMQRAWNSHGQGHDSFSSSSPPPPGFRQQHHSFSSSSSPPPPGFRPEYMPGGCNSHSSTYPGQGAYGHASQSNYGASSQSNTGGFWNGLATGGALGYLFGSRGNNNAYHQSGPSYPTSSGWGNTGFGSSSGGWGTAGSGGSSPPAASGSRTTSGFGGTKRR